MSPAFAIVHHDQSLAVAAYDCNGKTMSDKGKVRLLPAATHQYYTVMVID